MDVDPDIDHLDAGALSDNDDADYDTGARKRKKAADDDDEDAPCRLHRDDPANFMKLCSALKILVSPTLTDADIDQADQLMRTYCTELLTVSSFFCILCIGY